MKVFTYIFLFMVVVISIQEILIAQPMFPEAPQAPIDGGLGLLAAAGGAYALKKLRDRKKGEESDVDI